MVLVPSWLSGISGGSRWAGSFVLLTPAAAKVHNPTAAVTLSGPIPTAVALSRAGAPLSFGLHVGLVSRGAAMTVTVAASAMLALASASLRGCRERVKKASPARFQAVQLQAARTEAMNATDKMKGDDAEYSDQVEDDEDELSLLGYDTEDDEADGAGGDENKLEAVCRARYLQGSPLKFRRVLFQIRGRSYREALMLLEFLPWRHCKPTLKCLQSAAANAQNHFNMDKSRLYISRCTATKGPKMKRMRPVSKGQAHPYVKRSTHVTIWVAEMDDNQLEDLN